MSKYYQPLTIQEKLSKLMTTYRYYYRYAPFIKLELGEGEFTTKEYKACKSRIFHGSSPTIKFLLKYGIIKLARTENFTIEIDDEIFRFELPDGRILSEEEFCEIPFAQRLSIPVKATTVIGKKKIKGKRNYYKIAEIDKEAMLKEAMELVPTFFQEFEN